MGHEPLRANRRYELTQLLCAGCCCALLWMHPQSLRAQQQSADEVKLVLAGTVHNSAAQRLAARLRSELRPSLVDVREEVEQNRRMATMMRGARSGGHTGALLGATLGLALGPMLAHALNDACTDDSCYRTFRGRSSSTASAVVVGCLGYLAGGLLGALGETDEWKQPAYQLVQVGLSMDGEQGVGLAASVRF